MSQGQHFHLGENAQLGSQGDLQAQNMYLREGLMQAAQREADLQRQLAAVLQGSGSNAYGARASGSTSSRAADLSQQVLSMSLDGAGGRGAGSRSSQTAARAPLLPYPYLDGSYDREYTSGARVHVERIERDAQFAQELAAREQRQLDMDRQIARRMEALEQQEQAQHALEMGRLRRRQEEQAWETEAGFERALEMEAEERRQFERDQQMVRDLQAQERREQEQLECSQRLARQLDCDFECGICYEKVREDDQFIVGSGLGEVCGHRCCRSCAKSYITNTLRGNKLPVPCWTPGCQHTISEVEIMSVVEDAEAQLYQELNRLPVGDPGFRPCIEPNCKGFCLLDDPEEESACYCSVDLRHIWCCNCQVNISTLQHAGTSCERYQRWKAENDTGDAAMEQLLRAGLQDSSGNDRMRRCPRCRAPWMKDQACMHVVCERRGGGCGAHFCFTCAAVAFDEGAEVYAHQATCRGYLQPTA